MPYVNEFWKRQNGWRLRKMKKRNDMGVRVYGCMHSGGGERKMRPHKENDVPCVGAMRSLGS